MQRTLRSIAYGCLWFSCAFSFPAAPNIVDLGYAKYNGQKLYPNAIAYLGIPYAEPPVGDLRFRAPVPLNTSRIAEGSGGKPYDATAYPNFCVQGPVGVGDYGGVGTEDCLKVNVWAPPGTNADSKLPVLFYIHGGGYIYGNPRNWPFGHWVNQSPNVVIVSVYYRLDSFGFLTSPDFGNDPSLGDCNAGFQDQIQALKWIKQYIAAFGGDPNRVTINGQSAGASSVELHLVADVGEQLFSGAIAQSVYRTVLPLPAQQADLFNYYAKQAGCNHGQVSDQMKCLRSVSTIALAIAQGNSYYHFPGPYKQFRPVVDGKIIKDYPTLLLSEGKFAQVPLITGSTSNETLASGNNITTALQTYWPEFTVDDVNQFTSLYTLADFDSAAQQQLVATGDASVRCGRTVLADAFAGTPNSWAYRYNQPVNAGGTVDHSAENYIMFLGSLTLLDGFGISVPLTPIQTAFSQELIAYWLSFVRSGDPNTYKFARSPEWPTYSVQNPVRLVLAQDAENQTNESGVIFEDIPDEETQRCRFLVTKEQDVQA